MRVMSGSESSPTGSLSPGFDGPQTTGGASQQPSARAPMIVCVAVIGRNNNPLFIRTPAGESTVVETDTEDTRFHHLAHISCDFVDERLSTPALRPTEPYLGLIAAIDEHLIYAYATNTGLKFMAIVPEIVPCKDTEMRAVFDYLYGAYIQELSNPFYDPESTKLWKSRRFSEAAQNLLRVQQQQH